MNSRRFFIQLFAGVISITPANFFSQTGDLKYVKRTELKGIEFAFSKDTYYKKCRNKIFLLQKNKIDSAIVLSPISIDSGKVYEPIILNYNLQKKGDTFSDFYIAGDTAVLVTYNAIFTLSRKRENVYVIISSTDNKDKFHFCQVYGKNLLLTNCYNHHPLDAKINCGFRLYDLENLNVLHTQKLNFDGIGFTHNVNHFIDVADNKILLTNTLRNRAYIYDFYGRVKDSIGDNSLLNPGIDKCPVDMEFRKGRFSIKDSIYKLTKINRKLSRIEKIFFINDSTILNTTIPVGEEDDRIINIYKKTGQAWRVVCTNMKMNKADFFNWSFTRALLFTGNNIYFIDIKMPKNISKADDEYFRKNPFMHLYKYEYSY